MSDAHFVTKSTLSKLITEVASCDAVCKRCDRAHHEVTSLKMIVLFHSFYVSYGLILVGTFDKMLQTHRKILSLKYATSLVIKSLELPQRSMELVRLFLIPQDFLGDRSISLTVMSDVSYVFIITFTCRYIHFEHIQRSI